MGRLVSTACLGMPRTMCRPNFRPWACTQSASGLKPRLPVEEGKRAGDGDQQAMGIQEILPVLQLVPERVAHVPALVDHRVRPAVRAQFGQFARVGLEIGFVDGEAVGVPAVPSHGRGWGGFLCRRSGVEAQQPENTEAQL